MLCVAACQARHIQPGHVQCMPAQDTTGVEAHGGGSQVSLPVSEQPNTVCWAPGTYRDKIYCWHARQHLMVLCRPDTFSLGVCNGCQLMALLGWVPGGDLPDTQQPRFVHNASGRFECRWATVEIRPSPSVLLKAGAYDCPYCQCSRDMSPHILLL